MARTDAEILARMEEIKPDDFFGFMRSDLLERLSFEAAQPFLKEGVTADQWEQKSQNAEAVLADAKDYMTFAWDKANGCRGLSAGRSVQHMEAWLWLAGEDALLERMKARAYEFYGKPQLRMICEHFGWDWRALDDNQWRNDESGLALSADDVPA